MACSICSTDPSHARSWDAIAESVPDSTVLNRTCISLVRSALWITGSIVLVSLLATLMVFPLVFRYGMNPAQGSELVVAVHWLDGLKAKAAR